MKKYKNDFLENLIKSGDNILEKESFKFRKAKVLACNEILNSEYKELIGKIFDIKYSYDYEEMICIEYDGEELWIEDGEYEFVDELPEYIKDIANDKWIGRLNSTKEYYGSPLLEYSHFEKEYKVKNSCGLKVEDVLEDSNGYYSATEDEYIQAKKIRIMNKKEEIEAEIRSLQEELQALSRLEE